MMSTRSPCRCPSRSSINRWRRISRNASTSSASCPNVLKPTPSTWAARTVRDDVQRFDARPSGLSKLEREMIAVAVSSQNRCYYCLVAHGAAVRQFSNDPVLGELMVMNYRAARLSSATAMLDFAVKLTTQPWTVEETDPSGCAAPASATATFGMLRRSPLFSHDEPRGVRDRHAPEFGIPPAGALDAPSRSFDFPLVDSLLQAPPPARWRCSRRCRRGTRFQLATAWWSRRKRARPALALKF